MRASIVSTIILLIVSAMAAPVAAAEEKKSEGGVVRKDGDRVWIDKVPQIGWDKERTTTFGGALEAATAVTAHPFAYEDLMGMTGLAFRTRFFRGEGDHKWDPSSPVGEMEREIKLASAASGWEMKVIARLGPEKADVTDQIPEIVANIDAGKPVLGYDQQFNMLVIYGYEEAGKTLLVDDYSDRRPPIKVAAKDLNSFIIYLGKHDSAKETHAAVVEGLELALKQWNQTEKEKFLDGNYLLGKAALDEWIKNIEDYDKWTEAERNRLFFINWWVYCVLANARDAGSHFLRDHASEFSQPAADSLLKAADLFKQESDAAAGAWEGRVFMGPWQSKGFADWTPEVRAEEIKMLRDVQAKDAAAFAEIEKALAMEQP